MKATYKQIKTLKELGYDFEIPIDQITSQEASAVINEILDESHGCGLCDQDEGY